MSVSVWSNVQIAVQSALAAADTISSITKANPAVVTATAHGMSNGDYVVLTVQGMVELDSRVCRIASVATNTYELEGVDSTAFSTFSSGTSEKITFGTSLSVISNVNVSGGDFDQIDITTIHDSQKKQIPGAASPISISMTANWDPADAGLQAMKTASDTKALRAVLFSFANGSKWVWTGYIGCTLSPTGQAQGKVETPLSMTVYGKTSAYSS